jgi:hypothetical protein
MLMVRRRIDKLEKAFGLSDRKPPWEHHFVFVDGEGRVDRKQLLISAGRMEWVEVEVAEPAA